MTAAHRLTGGVGDGGENRRHREVCTGGCCRTSKSCGSHPREAIHNAWSVLFSPTAVAPTSKCADAHFLSSLSTPRRPGAAYRLLGSYCESARRFEPLLELRLGAGTVGSSGMQRAAEEDELGYRIYELGAELLVPLRCASPTPTRQPAEPEISPTGCLRALWVRVR
jgi:hypothetical protein